MRVVFMGTPHFAVPSLRALVSAAPPGHAWSTGLDLVGVITRLDKPSGRTAAPVPSPIKVHARELGLPVYQPGSLRKPEAQALLRRLSPDLIVVAAFGQILSPEVLKMPGHGCLNVHASLLPRYRGASPVAAAILAGETETGVTIMLMDEGLDTGPIVVQRRTPIAPDETAGSLTTRLAGLGADLLVETLPRWLAGGIAPIAQNDSQATMTRLLRKEDGHIDWSLPAEVLNRQVRAYFPWPGSFTTWQGRQLKVLHAHVLDGADGAAREPGEVFSMREESGREVLACACGQGALALEMVQLEGKRPLPAPEFLNGHAAIVSARLGA